MCGVSDGVVFVLVNVLLMISVLLCVVSCVC